MVAETCRETAGVQRFVERGWEENYGGLDRAGGMGAAAHVAELRGRRLQVMPAQTPSFHLLLQQCRARGLSVSDLPEE